jgi:hypothetical protein
VRRQSIGLLLTSITGCAAPVVDRQHHATEPGSESATQPFEDTAAPLDSDNDGLDDDEEAAIGTDPNHADTDRDRSSDGVEVAAGTNPLYDLSHPYAGSYNVGFCADGPPAPTGPTGTSEYGGESWPVYRPGDVARDFSFRDQHGEQVHLYSFCDRVVMLAFIGSGSDASLGLAAELETLQATYGPDGFQAIAVLVAQGFDQTGLATEGLEALAEDVVAEAGLVTVPLLQLTPAGQATGGTWNEYETDYALPTTAYLDGDMIALSIDDYEYDPGPWLGE